jgi:hypothetical protein
MSQQMDETYRQHAKSPLRTGRAQGGNLTTGDSNNNVSCQVEFGVAEVVTVSFDNTAASQDIEALAQATIEFTIDGVTIVRTIDVSAGASISGVAQAVRARVVDKTNEEFTASDFGQKYGVTISIAVMPRPTTAVPPVLTGAQALLNQNQSVTVQVPSGANSFAVYGSTAAAAPTLQAVQKTARGTAILMEDIATLGQFVPLLMGTGQVVVTNLSAAQAEICLVWGIDG